MTQTALAPLKPKESELLQRCEATIEAGLQTFLEVGNALVMIRDQKLYRERCQTFEDYCLARWQMGQSRAYQMIDAAKVVVDLQSSTIVELLLANESQARPMTALKKREERQRAWSGAVAKAGGKQPTAAQVKESVAVVKAVNGSVAPAKEAKKRADELVDAPRVENNSVSHGPDPTVLTELVGFDYKNPAPDGISPITWRLALATVCSCLDYGVLLHLMIVLCSFLPAAAERVAVEILSSEEREAARVADEAEGMPPLAVS